MKKPTPKKHWQVVIYNGQKYLNPYCEDAIKKIDEYKPNQLVHFNPVGETDERSAKQIRLYWQACKFVSERVGGWNFENYKRVDTYIRSECDLYDLENAVKDVQGNFTYAPLLSISFHNMKHLKACGYFKEAYETMCNLTPGYGFDIERFINAVKESCKGGR